MLRKACIGKYGDSTGFVNIFLIVLVHSPHSLDAEGALFFQDTWKGHLSFAIIVHCVQAEVLKK